VNPRPIPDRGSPRSSPRSFLDDRGVGRRSSPYLSRQTVPHPLNFRRQVETPRRQAETPYANAGVFTAQRRAVAVRVESYQGQAETVEETATQMPHQSAEDARIAMLQAAAKLSGTMVS
jgi:hypothetical protein